MGCGSNVYGNGRPAVPSCADTGWGCNYPMGMSPLELVNYDKDLYALYRTNGGMGSGMIDSFNYDPIVSTGIFASQYALSEGMAYAYLLTPDAQDSIRPGDGQIVPVDTYTNTKNLPPYEKVMYGPGGNKYEANYNGSQLEIQADMVAANGGNLPKPVYKKPFHPENNFAGDLSSFFAQESRITGPGPVTVDPPSLGGGSAAANPNSGIKSPVVTPPPVVIIGTGGLVPPAPPAVSSDTGGGIVSTLVPDPTALSVPLPTSATMGGGSMSGSSDEQAATADGSAPAAGTVAAPLCAFSWWPVIIGLVVLGVAGYFWAKHKHEDGKHLKTFTGGGAVIGLILGYLYSKHQCTPIGFLTSIGIPSKVASTPAPAATTQSTTSSFCAACGGM